jgi:PKD repeat protein
MSNATRPRDITSALRVGLATFVALCSLGIWSGCITGSDDGNQKPVASAGVEQTVRINRTIIFDGTGVDSDGNIALYEWDFDGDGKFDWSSPDSGYIEHKYVNAGTYNAALRVTDDGGAKSTSSIKIVVTPGELPVADAGGPYTAKVGLALTFTGDGNDLDGTIAKYEWDFDGDGDFDWESTTTGNASHTYSTLGTFTAILRVTDDEGNTGEAQIEVSVVIVTPIAGPYTLSYSYFFKCVVNTYYSRTTITYNGSGSKGWQITQSGGTIELSGESTWAEASGTIDENDKVTFSGSVVGTYTQVFSGTYYPSTGRISGTLTGKKGDYFSSVGSCVGDVTGTFTMVPASGKIATSTPPYKLQIRSVVVDSVRIGSSDHR